MTEAEKLELALKAEGLVQEFAARLRAERIQEVSIRVRSCDCGALWLFLEQALESWAFVVRAARGFAKEKRIHFTTEAEVCPACREPFSPPLSHQTTLSPGGALVSSEIVTNDPLAANPVQRMRTPARRTE